MELNLCNLVFWMVAPIIPYKIVHVPIHVPTYLGIKRASIFWPCIFLLLEYYTFFIQIHLRFVLSFFCIAKNKGMYELVSYD